jgi:filamentous hemagglutinin
MEGKVYCCSIEQARNEAIKWLEERNVSFGPYRKIEIGRMGVMTGREIGVSADGGIWWRLRIDYDPIKEAHYNAEVGRRSAREKMAFCFPGGEELINTIAKNRDIRV